MASVKSIEVLRYRLINAIPDVLTIPLTIYVFIL